MESIKVIDEKCKKAFFVQDQLDEKYKVIMKDKYLMEMLKTLLAIGNICNAGDSKTERADGFDLEFFTKLTTIKDNSKKKTLMMLLVELTHETHKKPFSDSLKTNRNTLNIKGAGLEIVIESAKEVREVYD